MHRRVRAISKARCTAAGATQSNIAAGARRTRLAGLFRPKYVVHRLTLSSMMWHSRWPARPRWWRCRWQKRGDRRVNAGCHAGASIRPGPLPGRRAAQPGTDGAPSSQSRVTSKTQVPNSSVSWPALQAFAAAHFHAAVMVTDGQEARPRLGTQKNVAGMGHGIKSAGKKRGKRGSAN